MTPQRDRLTRPQDIVHRSRSDPGRARVAAAKLTSRRAASIAACCELVFVSDTRRAVAGLVAQGLSLNEVAHRLGVARSTVGYHVEVLRRRAEPRTSPAHETRPAASPSVTRARVDRLISQGKTRLEVAQSLKLARSTVTFHARKLGYEADARFGKRYDWDAIRAFYEQGHTVAECRARFGFTRATWHEAVRRGLVTPRPARIPLDELLVAGKQRNRNHLKQRLYDAGLKVQRCETCGLDRWNGRPIPLALHHVNGDRNDNRLQNLEILCPNCHSQTQSWSGRNRSPHQSTPPRRDPALG